MVERRVRLLVQRQGLQLAGERGIEPPVRAVQTSEAVVDGPQRDLAASGLEERGRRLELHQRFRIVAPGEQFVTERMQRGSLEDPIRDGARVGNHLVGQPAFVFQAEGRRAQGL